MKNKEAWEKEERNKNKREVFFRSYSFLFILSFSVEFCNPREFGQQTPASMTIIWSDDDVDNKLGDFHGSEDMPVASVRFLVSALHIMQSFSPLSPIFYYYCAASYSAAAFLIRYKTQKREEK